MKNFVKNFFQQSGVWVGSSFLISKISAFIVTLLLARIFSKEDFGSVMYALNFLGFFLPFVGFGSSHGSLRYGAILPFSEKKNLFSYSFTYGFLSNLLLNAVMLIIAIAVFGKGERFFLISIFSIRLLGIFLLEQAKAEIRAEHNNKKFAIIDIFQSLLLLFIGLGFAYFFGKMAYVMVLCVSPFVVLLFHQFRFTKEIFNFEKISFRDFWKFSVSMAITNQLSELVFLLDVFFIGIMMNNVAVADYRIYSILPFNLFFIGSLFFQTSYSKLCENHENNPFQIKFLFNFWKLIFPLCVIILAVSFYFDKEILQLFGKKYGDTLIFRTLVLAAISVLLLRIPFGYLLASKGKSLINMISAIISILGILIFIKPVIKTWGLEGVAWLSFFNLLMVGLFLGAAYFLEVYKSSKN